MSLQRVLELARRQGAPVIVTDVAGREPLVILPLEAYEQLLDGGISGPEEGKLASSSLQTPSRSGGSTPTSPGTSPAVLGGEETPDSTVKQPKISQKNANDVVQEAVQAPVKTPPVSDGLRVRQRDEDRVSALHRSLDAVSEVSGSASVNPPGLLLEERFSFQP